MAQYKVQGPDGSLHLIEGPDGATPAQIEAFAAQSIPAARSAPKVQAYDPSAGGSTLNLAGFNTGIKTPQWLDRGLSGAGKSVSDTINGLGQWAGLVPQSTIDETKALDKPLMDTGAGLTGNILGQVAQMALPAGVAARTAPAAAAAAKASPWLSTAAQGAAFSATQPVASGDSREYNTVLGAAGALGGKAIAAGANRLALGGSDLISPYVKALYEKAQAAGIPVSVAQLSDSKVVKTIQSALSKLPFSGAGDSQAAQSQAFTRAVSKTFGEDSPQIDNQLYKSAKERIGGEFNRLSANNQLNPTPALTEALGAVSSDASRFAQSDTAKAVGNAIDEIMSKADPVTGKIPGRAYQSFDSKMGALTKGGDEKAIYIGQIRDAVRNAMDESISPADQAAWQTARAQYRNLKTIRDLVAKDDGSGQIDPALLMGRVTAKGADKEAMAMGNRGDIGDLAQIGRRFLRDPIPDSTTAQRNLIYSLLSSGGLAGAGAMGATPGQMMTSTAGLIGGGLLARGGNKLMNSPGLANYAVSGGGPVMNGLAVGVSPAPYLLPAYLNSR